MRLTLTVDLDPAEQVAGQPAWATVALRTDYAADLLTAACIEAADPHLPPEWSDCVASMIAARLLATGLRVGVPVVMSQSTAAAGPLRVRPVGV
ncbi:MAG: hypothetical protein ACRD2Z_01720 [Thermoanaerobaculia bacterium]